jgi:flagellin-like protein
MMRKGVSPVVATVLLIAIAVISAVAVWYWVAPLTSAQATPSTSQYGFVVTAVYKNSSGSNCSTVDIKNSGGTSIPALTTFEVRLISGSSAGKYVSINSTLAPGATSNYNVTSNLSGTMLGNLPNMTLGSYLLRAYSGASGITGFTDVYFTC